MIHSFNDIILKVGGGEIYASDFSTADGWAETRGTLNYPISSSLGGCATTFHVASVDREAMIGTDQQALS